MSNAQVGQVYQQIIQDVIEASRVDFEEGGIDEGVLDELRQVSHLLDFKVNDSSMQLEPARPFFSIFRYFEFIFTISSRNDHLGNWLLP